MTRALTQASMSGVPLGERRLLPHLTTSPPPQLFRGPVQQTFAEITGADFAEVEPACSTTSFSCEKGEG